MNKLAKKALMALFAIFFCLGLATAPVLAANLGDAFKVSNGSNQDALDATAGKAGYDTTKTDIFPLISKIINVGLSFLGVIFLLLILYGGFLWMTDRGSEEQVSKAKKLIQAAMIGLIIVLSSYAVSWFVLNVLVEATQK